MLVLILENLRSVENTASIFRTADGFGVGKIILVGTTPAPIDRFGRKRNDFAKISLGAEESVPWEYVRTEDLLPTLTELRDQGFVIAALEQDPKAEKLAKLTDDKLVLVVGNEVEGVSKETLSTCDVILEIPMHGTKESLNVAVATGIALFVLK